MVSRNAKRNNYRCRGASVPPGNGKAKTRLEALIIPLMEIV